MKPKTDKPCEQPTPCKDNSKLCEQCGWLLNRHRRHDESDYSKLADFIIKGES